jgi:hypothetical protein
MPEKMEENLRAEAEAKFPNDKKRQDAYVFGPLNKRKREKRRKKQHTAKSN